MTLRILIKFVFLAIVTGPADAEERALSWSFETQSGAAYELTIKGTWQEPGMAFWKEPSDVSVRARVEVIEQPEKARLVYGLCAFFFDEDDFEVFVRDFYIDSSTLLRTGKAFHADWTMAHKHFFEIEEARIVFDRNPPSLFRIRQCH